MVRIFVVLILFMIVLQLPLTAEVYYVDQNHASANDNNGGSEAAPWATIKKAATTASAGDTVLVKDGIYYDRVVFTQSGNASAYITIKTYPGHNPEINGQNNAQWDGLVNFSGVDYIRFEGFTVTNCNIGQAIYIIHNGGNPSTYIELRDLILSHIDDSGVQVRGNASYIVIENCVAHDFASASAFDASTYSGGRPHHVTVKGNEIYNSGFAGVGSERADDIVVENNIIYDSEIGIDIGSGKRNIIRNNSVTNCPDGIILSSNSDSEVYENTIDDTNEAMYAYYWSAHGEPHQNNKWYRNLIMNANFGFFEMDRKNTSADTGPTSGHEYYNNVFYNVGGGNSYRGTFWFRGADDIKFHHNSIYTRRFLEAEIFELVNNAENASFINNIVSLRGDKGLVFIEDGSSASFDYNCYYNRDGEVSAVGVNDTIADPLFVDVDEGNLYLQNVSPCIDNGINIGVFNDFDGNTRPVGIGFDMGAYEYDPANTILMENKVPLGYQLNQNYPNPFNPNTIIKYELPTTNYVNLSIFNVLGEKVATLVSERQNAGYYQVEWQASRFSSGVYYYRVESGEFHDVKKMILLR